MNIRWDIYRKLDNFSFSDAAYLWLEREPVINDEAWKNDPYDVRRQEERIRDCVKYRRWKVYLSQQDDPEEVIKKMVIENRCNCLRWKGDSPFGLEGILDIPADWTPPEERNKTPMSKDELWEKAKRDPVTDIERKTLYERMPPGSSEFKVSREELIEVAEELEETPRFLFPDISENASRTIVQNSEEQRLNPKRRNSYLKLIKGLLYKLKIDPGERSISKSLEGMITDAGETLTAEVVLSILKEVQALEEDKK
jgi:hypothetical protein